MYYVGVDLHKNSISLCVVNKAREVLRTRRFLCIEPHRIEAFFRELGPHQVVVEATVGYEWFLRLVEPYATRSVLAHPGKLRVIAESTRKSDKLDARVLAEFLALDMIPEAHRPTPRVRDHRALVRHRQYVQQRITATKSKIRRVLWDYNADRPDLFTRCGSEFLTTATLSMADRFKIDQLREQLLSLQSQLKQVNTELAAFAQQGTETEVEARRLLRTIPGVGEVTSEVVLAELGNVHRFGSVKKAVAYAGLAPGWRESAGKRKELSIEKKGSKLLRWVLIEAAWQLVRYDSRWRSVFEQLAKRTGKKKAITAVARRLLTLMVAILRSGEPYRSRMATA